MNDLQRTQMAAPPTVDPNRTMMGTAPSLNATQTIKPVQCPVCKAFNPVGMAFCVECGLIFDRALPDDAFGAPAVQLPVLVDTTGKEFILRPGEQVLGRQGEVMIEDGRISRRHARVGLENGSLWVEDMGSTNGTQVNGSPLGQGERQTIVNGGKLSLGGYELTLSMPGEAQKTGMLSGGRTAAIAAAPSVAAPKAHLVVGEDRYPLKAGDNKFGRRATNDVVIADPYVSGEHGIVHVEESGVFITDIGSTNGTFLNEAKLEVNQKTPVTPNDAIRLGGLSLRLETD